MAEDGRRAMSSRLQILGAAVLQSGMASRWFVDPTLAASLRRPPPRKPRGPQASQ